MSQLLKNNAYHILGLDTSAEQKDILKRSKEIINRLKVDEDPEYEMDVGIYKDFRSETSVKDAAQKLQIPKKKIEEYFFWFQIADSLDEAALAEIRKKSFDKAVKIWQDASGPNTAKAFFYKKNLAILYCLLLSVEDNKQYLLDSLQAWQEVVHSEKFWSAFSKVYKLHNEQTASQEIIDEFKEKVIGHLSNLYTDLYKIHGSDQYVNEFQKVFSATGSGVEKDVLNPIYQTINKSVEELESMNISEAGVLDKVAADKIKKSIAAVQTDFNRLIDLGLYDDSQTKVMRDRAATAIRKIVLDLHNNMNETGLALGLAKIANQISGTDSFKEKMQQDIKTLQDNFDYKEKEDRFKKIVDPIIEQFHSGESDKALSAINAHIYNENTDPELKKNLQDLKASIEERVVKHGKPVSGAPSLFTLNGCGMKIYGDTLYIVILFIPIWPLSRYSLESSGRNYSFKGKLELHKWQKYWRYIVIGIAVIWFFSAISK